MRKRVQIKTNFREIVRQLEDFVAFLENLNCSNKMYRLIDMLCGKDVEVTKLQL